MATEKRARFTTGSTMRHVIVMTTTGMLGMTFMFLVDLVTLFWVSQLEVEMFMAAISYAWTIQFFTIAFAVAFMIAAAALVAARVARRTRSRLSRSSGRARMVTGIVSSPSR